MNESLEELSHTKEEISMTLLFKKLREEGTIPVKANPTDAGYDIFLSEDVTMYAGETYKLPTAIAMAIPEGSYGAIEGRSGNNSNTKLRILKGVIDADYRGEVMVMAEVYPFEVTDEVTHGVRIVAPIKLTKGTKIAQLVHQPLAKDESTEVDELPVAFYRGTSGFGSTGGNVNG